MRGANCWTDHRLVITKLSLRLRPPVRPIRAKPTSLNLHRLENKETQLHFANTLNCAMAGKQLLQNTKLEDFWQDLSKLMIDTAKNVFGLKPRVNEDWFNENDKVLTETISNHRSLLRKCDLTSQDHAAKLKVSSSELERRHETICPIKYLSSLQEQGRALIV